MQLEQDSMEQGKREDLNICKEAAPPFVSSGSDKDKEQCKIYDKKLL